MGGVAGRGDHCGDRGEAALSYLDHEWHGLINDAHSRARVWPRLPNLLVFAVITVLWARWLADSNTIPRYGKSTYRQ
jgi:hypothetical protein